MSRYEQEAACMAAASMLHRRTKISCQVHEGLLAHSMSYPGGFQRSNSIRSDAVWRREIDATMS